MKHFTFFFSVLFLLFGCKSKEQKEKEFAFEVQETFEGSRGNPLPSKEFLERMENVLGIDSTAKYLISHEQYLIPADRFSEELKNAITSRSFRELSYDQHLLWARKIDPETFFKTINKIPLDDLADFAHQNPDDSMLIMNILPFLSTRPFENYRISPAFIKSTSAADRKKIISTIRDQNLFLSSIGIESKPNDSLVKDSITQNPSGHQLSLAASKITD